MSATAFQRKRRLLAAQANETPEQVNTFNADLHDLTLKELRALAKDKGITGYSNLNKQQAIEVLSK